MKISHMLKREDFYRVNQETLDRYCSGDAQKSTLYIYPELNAIVTKNPSANVKRYLYVEYGVQGSLIKKILVFFYTRIVINTRGLFSPARCVVSNGFGRDSLIYPCNKKIRIFDFENETVRVVPKSGFPVTGIINEIAFRTNNHAPFIPPIVSQTENTYTEKIIDGYPLARAKQNYTMLMDKAWTIWQDYIMPSVHNINSDEYIDKLHSQFLEIIGDELFQHKSIDKQAVTDLEKDLYDTLKINRTMIPVGLSHGDMQPGNIWVGNETEKIYIIDWESYAERSVYYDDAALHRDLRKMDGVERMAGSFDQTDRIVLYEDLISKLNELISLPFDFGACDFTEYLQAIQKGKSHV